MTKEEILKFIHKNDLCIVSTMHDDHRPQGAVVGFSENKNFELLIGTSVKSRKYKNIQNNPHVAVVIGYANKITVQYEGTAQILGGPKLGPEFESRMENHFRKLPSTRKYLEKPEQRWILIKPTWLRYTDANQNPWYIEEINF